MTRENRFEADFSRPAGDACRGRAGRLRTEEDMGRRRAAGHRCNSGKEAVGQSNKMLRKICAKRTVLEVLEGGICGRAQRETHFSRRREAEK